MQPPPGPVRHRVPAAAGPRRRPGRADAGRQRRHAGRRARTVAGSGDRPAAVPMAALRPGRDQCRRRCRPRPVDADGAGVLAHRAGRRPDRAGRAEGAAAVRPSGGQRASTSTPQPVTGYGAVGVTWEHGVAGRRRRRSRVQVRTLRRTAPGRTGPSAVPRRPRPRPGQRRGRARPPGHRRRCWSATSTRCRSGSRPTTPPPADMKLAVIDPGEATTTAARAARDRHRRARPATTTSSRRRDDRATATASSALRAATYTPQAEDLLARAVGRRRAACGTRGRCTTSRCTPGSCTTRSTPTTTRATRCRASCAASTPTTRSPAAGATSATTSWSTGSAGSGRAGTAASTARSSVRTRSATTTTRSRCRRSATSRPRGRPQAMIQAYGALFAWKLSLHGVNADVDQAVRRPRGTSRRSTVTATPARPPARASTSTPGSREIRELAAAAQQGWDGRELESNLAGSARPDLVVRRASDGRVFVLPDPARPTPAYRLGQADRDRARCCPTSTGSSTPATGTATASAT